MMQKMVDLGEMSLLKILLWLSALALDHYICGYNSERIKESLGWMSPLEYRCSLGYTG